ncbi:MAG: hypothetical protein AAGG08_02005 [Actinomycetota bacterium]
MGAALAGVAMIGAACASDTTATSAPVADAAVAQEPGEAASPDRFAIDDAEVDEPASPPEPEPDTALDSEPEPEVAPDAEPASDPDPRPEPEPEPEPGPCGTFGPIPARPDSMPTLLADTDEDGELDDEVTAYGSADGWAIRVVEDGVISESLMPTVEGFAFLTDVFDHGDGLVIGVLDADTGDLHEFRMNDLRCVEQIGGPVPGPVDDLLAVPSQPGPVVNPEFLPDDGPALGSLGPCGTHGPIPDDALIGTDGIYDLNDSDEVRLVTWSDGDTWFLRQQWGTTVSEIEIPNAGVHGVRVIGLADVAGYGGREILAVVGGGASGVQVGVFSSFEGPCLFQFQRDGGGAFVLDASVTIGSGAGIVCGDQWIASTGYQLEDDDTYTVFGAAYHEVATATFGYLPGSDDHAEGIAADDLDHQLFDCDDLTL